MTADRYMRDPRLTINQGIEMQRIQFDEGCVHTVCVDIWGDNCHCMDTLCERSPELVEKRAFQQRASRRVSKDNG